MPTEQQSRSPIYRSTKPFLLLGEVAARWPLPTLMVLAVLSALMAIGLTKLQTDDALEEFLESSTPDYQAFERLRQRFPASDLDVYLAVDGPDLLSPKHLQQMQDLNFELLLSDSVASVVSIFSLREPIQDDGLPATIIPSDQPLESDDLTQLETRLDGHPLASDRLISKSDAGNRLALFIVALDRDEVARQGLPVILSELNGILSQASAASDLRLGLAGIPAMKMELIEGVRRDLIVFNAAGLFVGAAVLGFFFRRIRLVLIALLPGLLALVWCLGMFGWTDTHINPLMNAVMPLVLVVTFNNAMHFLFAVCRNLDAGVDKATAIQRAILEIGPACALTSITSSIALFSLMLSSSVLIQSFGLWAGLSLIIALALVIVLMPMLPALFLKQGETKYLGNGSTSRGVGALHNAAAAISSVVCAKPRPIAIAGLLLTAVFALAYFQLEPRYRLSDMLPDKGTSADVAKRIENRLGGLFPLSVLVEWPETLSPQPPAVREVVRQTHEALQRNPAISKVNSIYDLQSWAESAGLAPDEASRRLDETVPPVVMSRFVNAKRHAALVSGYIGDLEAKEILKVSGEIEPELEAIRARYPEFTLTLTGLASVGATRSTSIIAQLSISMLGAVVVVITVIGLAFRSFYYASVSTIPNLFALFSTGTWLALVEGGLHYATIVGLTVAFGLAVDDTIHVLNRFEIEKRRSSTTLAAVDRTMRLIGIVLILTTAVILAGLLVTQVSVVPPIRQFGVICILTLIFALVADLVILPALILVSSRFRGRALWPWSADDKHGDRDQPQQQRTI